ncbi:MAG: zinc ribbon domain-containing protein [Bacteroidales bacterium]
MKNELPVLRYTCPKCSGKKYSVKGVVIQHSQASQIFNLPGTRYTAVTCEKCRYTEFYNTQVKNIKEAFDFFPGRV